MIGCAVVEPGGKTGVHHHGGAETASYVIGGVARCWVARRLDDVRQARAGDLVVIGGASCAGSRTQRHRAGGEGRRPPTQGAVVVTVHDHPHAPERAS